MFFCSLKLNIQFDGYLIFRILKIRGHLEQTFPFTLLQSSRAVLIFHNKYSYWDNIILTVAIIIVHSLHREPWNSNGFLHYIANITDKALQTLWYFRVSIHPKQRNFFFKFIEHWEDQKRGKRDNILPPYLYFVKINTLDHARDNISPRTLGAIEWERDLKNSLGDWQLKNVVLKKKGPLYSIY